MSSPSSTALAARFRLSYDCDPQLPKLAWCAVVSNEGTVSVRHGPWVDTAADAFFEGAWDGALDAQGFLEAQACLGSGGRLCSEGISFAAPSHTLERLHTLRLADRVVVSNSLAFLLIESDDSYRLDYPFYQHDLLSIVDGLDAYVRHLPTARGRQVRLHYHCNLTVASDLSMREHAKPPPPAFGGYEDYLGFVTGCVERISDNARDPARRQTFQPLTTISSGYDSPAAAVLAMDVGCHDALTFADAREDFSELDDSGRAIGERLGLEVHEYPRTGYRERRGCVEAEFLAGGSSGQEVIMAAMDELLPATVLYTGFHGDRAWAHGVTADGSRIARQDTSGASMAEFRLRLGFIHFPIPFLGCVNQRDIDAVSNSEAMAPWSIDNVGRHRTGYNRPIPRRMVEDRGVPREWFGQSKKAAGQPFGMYPREHTLSNLSLGTRMSADSMNAFETFSRDLKPEPNGFERMRFPLMRLAYELRLRLRWRARSSIAARRLLDLLPVVDWRYQGPLSKQVFLFHWGLERTMQRYRSDSRAADEDVR